MGNWGVAQLAASFRFSSSAASKCGPGLGLLQMLHCGEISPGHMALARLRVKVRVVACWDEGHLADSPGEASSSHGCFIKAIKGESVDSQLARQSYSLITLKTQSSLCSILLV